MISDVGFTRFRDVLGTLPTDSPVVLLLRHAHRHDIPNGEVGTHVGLTPEGEHRATWLGQWLGARIVAVRSSPVGRCVRTAECLLKGAGLNLGIVHDPLLGDPGCFSEQGDVAWQSFLTLGTEGVYLAQLQNSQPLEGFRPTHIGVDLLLSAVPDEMAPPGIHVWVTHDAILGILLAACAKRTTLTPWPGFLEGLWLVRRGPEVRLIGYGLHLRRQLHGPDLDQDHRDDGE